MRLVIDRLDGSHCTQAFVSKGVCRGERDGAPCQRTRQPLRESPIACTDFEHTQRRGERARRGGGLTWVVRAVLVRGKQEGARAATRWAATAAGYMATGGYEAHLAATRRGLRPARR